MRVEKLRRELTNFHSIQNLQWKWFNAGTTTRTSLTWSYVCFPTILQGIMCHHQKVKSRWPVVEFEMSIYVRHACSETEEKTNKRLHLSDKRCP